SASPEVEGLAGPLSRFPPQMRKNHASVDSELSLLLHDHPPMTGILPNPLFRQIPSPEAVPVIRVTRLDGPSLRSVLQIIRHTLRAEEVGLRGRAYFDLAQRRGNY